MQLDCGRSVGEVHLDCSQVVGSRSVVRDVAEVHLDCSQLVGSRSVVGLCPECS